jgi:hypothetical protein
MKAVSYASYAAYCLTLIPTVHAIGANRGCIDAKMAGSDENVRRLPAMYYHNSDSSIFEDEDSSVCGVVYITSEGGAYQPKSSQNKVLQQSEPYARTCQEKCSSKRTLLTVALTVGALLLLALGIGIAVGGHDVISVYAT